MSIVLASQDGPLKPGGSSLGLSSDDQKALVFSTGSADGILSSVTLGLNPPGSTTPEVISPMTGAVQLSLWSAQSVPGGGYYPVAPLSTSPVFNVSINARRQWYTFTSFNPVLYANSTYAFVLSSDVTGLKWSNVDIPPITPPQVYEGYSYLGFSARDNVTDWYSVINGNQAVRLDVALQPGLIGNAEPNLIVGTPANDLIEGLGANDTLAGMQGNDVIRGGTDDDLIYGARGNDTLIGGDGLDSITGGYGDDWLDGFTGNDRLTGGVGADRFVLSVGLDVVTDFTIADGDLVLIPPSFDYSLTQIGNDLLLEIVNQGALLLLGVDQQQFEAAAPVSRV